MKNIFLVSILLFLSSCVAMKPVIKEDYDKLTNARTIRLVQNLCPQNKSGSVEFNMAHHSNETSLSWIWIKYFAKDWLSIIDGKSLILLVDGETIELSGKGSFNNRHVGNYGINETASYPISKEVLEKLAKARRIEGKLFGAVYYESFFLDENNRKAVRDFNAKIEQ
jgi:hypothetical protein